MAGALGETWELILPEPRQFLDEFFSARQHMLSPLYAIVRRLRPSVTRVDQSATSQAVARTADRRPTASQQTMSPSDFC